MIRNMLTVGAALKGMTELLRTKPFLSRQNSKSDDIST